MDELREVDSRPTEDIWRLDRRVDRRGVDSSLSLGPWRGVAGVSINKGGGGVVVMF